jgi:hypothetical protein
MPLVSNMPVDYMRPQQSTRARPLQLIGSVTASSHNHTSGSGSIYTSRDGLQGRSVSPEDAKGEVSRNVVFTKWIDAADSPRRFYCNMPVDCHRYVWKTRAWKLYRIQLWMKQCDISGSHSAAAVASSIWDATLFADWLLTFSRVEYPSSSGIRNEGQFATKYLLRNVGKHSYKDMSYIPRT